MKYKRLSYEERIKIEVYLREGKTGYYIARKLNRTYKTIYDEIRRGTVSRLNSDLTYSDIYYADVGERIKQENIQLRVRPLKVGSDVKYLRYLEYLVKECNYSPYAALMFARNIGVYDTDICTSTFYNYVRKKIFLNLKYSDLPYHKKHYYKGSDAPRRAHYNLKGRNIAERPENALKRLKIGHWEGDTVVSCKGDNACLLVLTERASRMEIIRKIPDRKAGTVVNAFNDIFKEYTSKPFKTITFDNGMEFMNWLQIENDKNGKQRTKIYFCNAFRSCERGSNENNNKLIRRFIPKKSRISDYTENEIQYIENHINNYPRKIFNGKTSKYMYKLLR